MLIGNYSVLTKTPGRMLGGALGLGLNRTDNYKPSTLVARFGTLANHDPKSAQPDGYRPPYAWALPLRAGALASRGMMVGTGATTNANLAGGKNAVAALSGTGTIDSAIGSLILDAVASLSGSGTINAADLNALGVISASLSGSSDLAADGLLAEILEAVASLSGSGTVSAAALGARAGMSSDLTGAGSVDATATGVGSMSADLTLASGGTLTAQAVADAVWAQAIEAGLSADDVLRLIAAASAGKLSGAATTTIRIRDLADTTDRIVATVDSSGNRSAITLDPD
ncbi:MAG: hypothetical protein IT183_06865 [Acidobacteria bacterium]|nr:hypothetical protein [Acidobacteriota bacterium]